MKNTIHKGENIINRTILNMKSFIYQKIPQENEKASHKLREYICIPFI